MSEPGENMPGSYELPLMPSHRSTTSSRKPGKKFEDTLWVQTSGVVDCSECDGKKAGHVPPGAHAPRVVVLGCGHLGLQNCAREQIADCLACFTTREAA